MVPAPSDAGYEAAADAARAAMVERLRAAGASDATRAAFAAVPRHRLVERFWTFPMIDDPSSPGREHGPGDVAGVRALHDPDRAYAVKPPSRDTGATTSTASAPALLAVQADLLALEPGMHVLEIGTGPGYFAAILAELVGHVGQVVSIDIDAEVADGAASRLEHLGYDNVTVLVRDGHTGAPDLAPFDRVVGSVGCTDVAAAWLAQLVPDGNALIPLLHGAMHPMVQLDANGEGGIVTRSGYVAIQGVQHEATLWPHARAAAVRTKARAPLPGDLAAALVVTPDRGRLGSLGEWNLAFWVAVRDQRAGSFVELNDGAGSSARVDARAGNVVWGGPSGRPLAADLVDHGARWLAAGAPTAEDLTHRFVPIGTAAKTDGWVVSRVDHDQIVRLDRRDGGW